MPNPNHRFLVVIFVLCWGIAAHAHVLHVGNNSFRLDTEKHTTPALALKINDTLFWGGLYPGEAPGQTMHVLTDTEYWLGQNCAGGTYSETGISECTNCGLGHYCTGGKERKSCTYGAISCTDANHATDPAMPPDAPINKFMTMDEVHEFIPSTDFSQWKEISCCRTIRDATYTNYDSLNNASNACATGTIGPGTYLFVARYTYLPYSANYIDSIYGSADSLSNAFIAVFDHPASYASMHGAGIFQHFVDTTHTQYTAWTISTASVLGWQINKNETNISNWVKLPDTALCVYELR